MTTPNKLLPPKLVLLLTLLLLTGCASKSPPSPPEVVRSPILAPLPPSVTQIDSKPSEAYTRKVSTYLSKAEASLSGATSK